MFGGHYPCHTLAQMIYDSDENDNENEEFNENDKDDSEHYSKDVLRIDSVIGEMPIPIIKPPKYNNKQNSNHNYDRFVRFF